MRLVRKSLFSSSVFGDRRVPSLWDWIDEMFHNCFSLRKRRFTAFRPTAHYSTTLRLQPLMIEIIQLLAYACKLNDKYFNRWRLDRLQFNRSRFEVVLSSDSAHIKVGTGRLSFRRLAVPVVNRSRRVSCCCNFFGITPDSAVANLCVGLVLLIGRTDN